MTKFLTLTVAFALIIGFTGCSKKEGAETTNETVNTAKESVDTAQLEASFATADAPTKTNVDKAVEAIKSADYSGAIAQLQTTLAAGKVTPEQEQSIKNVLGQLQERVVNKAAEGANKVIGDLQNSISK